MSELFKWLLNQSLFEEAFVDMGSSEEYSRICSTNRSLLTAIRRVSEREGGEGFVADNRERSSPAVGSQKDIAEKRREKRYDVSSDFQKYIKLQVKNGSEFVHAVLGNFSRNGILFECPVPFSQGEHTKCVLSISLVLSREISFGIKVRYCYSDHGSHITGASIDTISDETWFDAFVEVHDSIVLRQGSHNPAF